MKNFRSFFAALVSAWAAAAIVLVLSLQSHVIRYSLSTEHMDQFAMSVAVAATFFAVPAIISNWLKFDRWMGAFLIASALTLVCIRLFKVDSTVAFNFNDCLEAYLTLMVVALPTAMAAVFAASW